MGKTAGCIIACGALVALGATGVSAQSIESIMRARERLELTDEQLESLDALRRESVQERMAVAAEREELRSRLEAGQIRRSELMAFMEERRDEREALMEERRGRVEGMLSDDQLESLRQMRQSARRMGARPGGRPGMDGPGFAPLGRAGQRGNQRSRRGPPRAALRGPGARVPL